MIKPISLLVEARRISVVAQTLQKAWLVGGGALLLSLGQAEAALYISSTVPFAPGQVPLSDSSWAGISFTTDGQDYYLDEVEVLLSIASFTPGSDLTGILYVSDNGGMPISPVVGPLFNHTSLSISTAYVGFTPTAVVVLTANTNYTFVITSDDPALLGGLHVVDSANPTHTDVPGSSWSMPAAVPYTLDGGESWINGGDGTRRASGSIYATPVPEPSSLLLLGAAGALGCGWHRARRQRGQGGQRGGQGFA